MNLFQTLCVLHTFLIINQFSFQVLMPILGPPAPILLEDSGRWERKFFPIIWLYTLTPFIVLDRGRFAFSRNVLNNTMSLKMPVLSIGLLWIESNYQPSRMSSELVRSNPLVHEHIWYVSEHQLWVKFQRTMCLERGRTGSLAPPQSLTSKFQYCPPFS